MADVYVALAQRPAGPNARVVAVSVSFFSMNTNPSPPIAVLPLSQTGRFVPPPTARIPTVGLLRLGGCSTFRCQVVSVPDPSQPTAMPLPAGPETGSSAAKSAWPPGCRRLHSGRSLCSGILRDKNSSEIDVCVSPTYSTSQTYLPRLRPQSVQSATQLRRTWCRAGAVTSHIQYGHEDTVSSPGSSSNGHAAHRKKCRERCPGG